MCGRATGWVGKPLCQAIAAGNFAITVVLSQRFACEAARYLSQWEIIDYASDAKHDAPSGTARKLAYRLDQVRQPQPTIPVDQTAGGHLGRHQAKVILMTNRVAHLFVLLAG